MISYEAFASAQDPRRYWKDFNFQLNLKKFESFLIESKLIFQRHQIINGN